MSTDGAPPASWPGRGLPAAAGAARLEVVAPHDAEHPLVAGGEVERAPAPPSAATTTMPRDRAWPISRPSSGSAGPARLKLSTCAPWQDGEVHRLGQRVAVAHRLARARRLLPAGLEGVDLRLRRDADDPDVVVGGGGDQPGDGGAVDVAGEALLAAVDEALRLDHPAAQVGVVEVDAGVDHRDAHPLAGGPAVRPSSRRVCALCCRWA